MIREYFYYKKWIFLRSPLVEAYKGKRLKRHFLDVYSGIRYALPYWATPKWRRWLRDISLWKKITQYVMRPADMAYLNVELWLLK